MGTVAVTKRLSGVIDVYVNIICESDDFEIVKHIKRALHFL